MTSAASSLESVFYNAECRLNVIMCRLDEELAKFDSQQMAQELAASRQEQVKPAAMNPLKMRNALLEIRQGMKDVRKKYETLTEEVETAKAKLTVACSSLSVELEKAK